MGIMTNRSTHIGIGLLLFLVALAVLTGCQPGPTKVQEAQNIEEPRQNAEQADTAEVTSPPAKPGSTAAFVSQCQDMDIADPAPCCKCENVGPSEEVICLTAKEMRDHVDHLEPLKRPGMADPRKFRVRGIVSLGVWFDPAGNVSRVQLLRGHPLVIGVALNAVKKWTFKPVVKNGVKRGGCGIVTIKFRFRVRDREALTELQ